MRQTWERKYAKPFLTLKIIILIHLNFFEWLFLVWVFLVRLIFSLWKVLKIFKTSHYIMCVFTKSYPALCDPLDCSPPGFSVHGISQARILEWVAGSFSRGSPCPRDPTQVSCTGRRILFHWATTLFLKMRMGFSWSCFPRQRVCANPSTYSSFLYS